MSVIIISQQWAQVRSLSKFAQSLISLDKIHTCNGRFIFLWSRDGGRVVRAFLPSCLLEEGNLRIILWRAGSVLNLDGHGLIRLTLANLKQMGGVSLSSLQCYWLRVWCGCGVWQKSCKTPTADWRRLSVLQTDVWAPSVLWGDMARREMFIFTLDHITNRQIHHNIPV